MVHWGRYFDAVYCLHYLDGSQERKDILRKCKSRLDSVGLLYDPIFNFQYGVNDPYRTLGWMGVTRSDIGAVYGDCLKLNHYDCTIDHFRAIKTYYELGCDRLLILEDDIAFLKDKCAIEDYLNNLPQYDICNFDYLEFKGCASNEAVNSHYNKFKTTVRCSMVGLSRAGMKYVIDNISSRFMIIDNIFCENGSQVNFGTGTFTYENKSTVEPIMIKPTLRLGIQDVSEDMRKYLCGSFEMDMDNSLYDL